MQNSPAPTLLYALWNASKRNKTGDEEMKQVRFRMQKTVILALVAGICLLSIANNAMAATAKFGHVGPLFHGQTKGVEAFAAYVKEKTNGRIDIATFPNGQLGGEQSLAEQVQSGTLQMATITSAAMQNFVPEAIVMDMPFAFPNRKTAYAVIDDPEFQAKYFSYFPKKGFIAIGWTENEFRDLSNNKRPVHKPADVKGLKIRVINSPLYIDMFKVLGASPVGIPFPEIYNALQTGVIDAQENPIMTTELMNFTEVTKHITLTKHTLTECIIVVSVDYWESLSPADQQIFRDAAKECLKTNRAVNAELQLHMPKSGLSVLEFAKKNGVEVVELTEAERAQFKAAMQPVWEEYRQKIGPEMFDFFLKKIKEHQQ